MGCLSQAGNCAAFGEEFGSFSWPEKKKPKQMSFLHGCKEVDFSPVLDVIFFRIAHLDIGSQWLMSKYACLSHAAL